MTVFNQISSISFLGNGDTTVFPFIGLFFAPSDLVVTLVTVSTGVTVTPNPTLNGTGAYDYAVAGALDAASGEYLGGGNVVFNTAPAAGLEVIVERNVPATQNVALIDNSPFPAKAVEGALDRATIIVQQVADAANRSVRVPFADLSTGPGLVLPAQSIRANGVQCFDANGNVTTIPLQSFYPAAGFPTGALLSFVTAPSINAAQGILQTYVTPTGVDLTGGTDSTAALQACLTAFGGKQAIRCPAGVYKLSATLYAPQNTVLIGDGPQLTIFERTGDYGSTLVCGNPAAATNGAGGFICEGIWFYAGSGYPQGSTSLQNLTTHGSHIELYGSQDILLRNNYFWRMPYGVVLHGGSIFRVENNLFYAVWDPLYPAAQEGIACLSLDATSVWGNPKDLFLTKNEFTGQPTGTRTYTLTASDGSKTVTGTVNAGPQNNLYVNGCESILADHNYFGGASTNNIFLNSSGAGYIGDVRIANNFFDGATQRQIFVQSGNNYVNLLTISDNQFNGENNTYQHIFVQAVGTAPSVSGLLISGNTFSASYGSCVSLLGAVGGNVTGNIFTGYNSLDVSPGGDAEWCAGVYIDAYSAYISVHANLLGGGGNAFSQALNPNYCFQGITILDSNSTGVKTTCLQSDNNNAGVITSGGAATFNPQQIGYTTVPSVDNAWSLGNSSFRFAAVWAANGTIQTSLAEQKDILGDAPGLDVVLKLKPKAYAWKSDTDKREHWGLTFEDVCDAFPAASHGVAHDGGGVAYAGLIAPLVRAVQELSAKIGVLEAASVKTDARESLR